MKSPEKAKQKPAFLKKLFPFESRFAEIAGHRMHYIDEGTGPVVVLLHGNPTWSFYYRGLIEALRPHFRVIAPDYIGCGLSDHPKDAHFRATHRTQHVKELLSKLGAKKFSLVMHDWGGAIGTALAVEDVGAVEKLVYLNTTLTETETLPAIIKTAARPFIGKILTKTTMRFLKLTTNMGVVKRLPKPVKKAYYYPYRSRARRTAIWDFVADIPFKSSHPSYPPMLDLAHKIPSLAHVPVQIVWGLRDPCFHREMLTKVAEHFPHAHILEIPDASHLVLEDALELSAETILNFLTQAPRPGATMRPPHGNGGNEKGSELYSRFLGAVEKYPDEYAAIVPSFLGDTVKYTQLTYRDLNALINKYQRGFAELGLVSGDRVLMLVSPGIEFLALSFAVMGRGAIPFFLDPGMGKEKLFECIKEIDPQVFLGSPKAQILRIKRSQLFPNLKFHLTASDWIFTGGPNLSFLKRFAAKPLAVTPSPGTVLVAYTSGSTGTPKGVVFTDAMVHDQLRIFEEVFGIQPRKKDVPLLPIFSLFNLALGVGSVFPQMDPAKPLAIEPWKVLKLMSDWRPNYSFGSPTLWNKIAEYCVRSRKKIESIEKVFMAGAPVSALTLKQVQDILVIGETFTPYGATEALPVTLVSAKELKETPECVAVGGEIGTLVGKPASGVELRVIETTDSSIADISQARELLPREIGEVIVRGGNVSLEYFKLPDKTAEAKIRDGNTAWHRMGDVGYRDDHGNLFFCGRKAHSVFWKGRAYYSIPVERIFNRHVKVARSALVSLHDGAELGLVVEPFPDHWPTSDEERAQFANELRALALQHDYTRPIEKFFFHESFPVDARHNAKIFRDELSVWASRMDQLRSAA